MKREKYKRSKEEVRVSEERLFHGRENQVQKKMRKEKERKRENRVHDDGENIGF